MKAGGLTLNMAGTIAETGSRGQIQWRKGESLMSIRLSLLPDLLSGRAVPGTGSGCWGCLQPCSPRRSGLYLMHLTESFLQLLLSVSGESNKESLHIAHVSEISLIVTFVAF